MGGYQHATGFAVGGIELLFNRLFETSNMNTNDLAEHVWGVKSAQFQEDVPTHGSRCRVIVSPWMTPDRQAAYFCLLPFSLEQTGFENGSNVRCHVGRPTSVGVKHVTTGTSYHDKLPTKFS